MEFIVCDIVVQWLPVLVRKKSFATAVLHTRILGSVNPLVPGVH